MGQMAMAMGKLGTLEGFLRQVIDYLMSDMCHVILRCHRYIELTDDMHV
jgi:hypothetical protein